MRLFLGVSLMVVALVLSFIGLHNIDIAWNMDVINLYSKMVLDVEYCHVEFPALWDGDMSPDGGLHSSISLYLMGVKLLVVGFMFYMASWFVLLSVGFSSKKS